MKSGRIYPALVSTLEGYRARPEAALAALVNIPAEQSELLLDGELVHIEVSVVWANAKQTALVLEATALGSATWLTERVTERIRIELRSPFRPAPAGS